MGSKSSKKAKTKAKTDEKSDNTKNQAVEAPSLKELSAKGLTHILEDTNNLAVSAWNLQLKLQRQFKQALKNEDKLWLSAFEFLEQVSKRNAIFKSGKR